MTALGIGQAERRGHAPQTALAHRLAPARGRRRRRAGRCASAISSTTVGDLELAVGGIGIAGLARRRGRAPWPARRRAAPGVGLVEEEARADRALDRRLDLGPHRLDDPPQPPDPRRHPLDRLEIVADRLLARDVGQRAEDGARRSPAARPSPSPVRRHALHAGLGIDIDEAAVDLAPRRPLLERRDRRAERRVGEHRAVDQHRLLGLAAAPRAGAGRGRGRRRGPARPARASRGTGRARRPGRAGRRRGSSRSRGRRRRARPDRRGGAPSPPGSLEGEGQPMLGLDHLGRRIEPQLLGIAVEIGDGDEQVERLIVGQQRVALRPLLPSRRTRRAADW